MVIKFEHLPLEYTRAGHSLVMNLFPCCLAISCVIQMYRSNHQGVFWNTFVKNCFSALLLINRYELTTFFYSRFILFTSNAI